LKNIEDVVQKLKVRLQENLPLPRSEQNPAQTRQMPTINDKIPDQPLRTRKHFVP
jgi:hypothetical protein